MLPTPCVCDVCCRGSVGLRQLRAHWRLRQTRQRLGRQRERLNRHRAIRTYFPRRQGGLTRACLPVRSVIQSIGWVKKVSCRFWANMLIKLRTQEECKQTRTAEEKMKRCLIFSREIFYATIVLCLIVLSLKAVNETAAGQTRTSLRKHDVISV